MGSLHLMNVNPECPSFKTMLILDYMCLYKGLPKKYL